MDSSDQASIAPAQQLPQQSTSTATNTEGDREELIEATLFRLTQGLPRAELDLILSESEACEAELLKEIELLEKASSDPSFENESPEVKAILECVLTPLDQYWTASALLGRLRDDMMLPRIPTAAASPYAIAPAASHSKQQPHHAPVDASALIEMQNNPAYTQQHDQPTQLLALYKKLSSHRSAHVFRKAVKDEEAPGYSDRIRFKMDLGLLRRLIVSNQVVSYHDFHKYAGLIAHNCVKFNGRESDYGMLAREFEQAADEMVRHAVLTTSAQQQGGAISNNVDQGSGAANVGAEKTNVDKADAEMASV
ncbi:hypothetical protein MPSEU_000382800 [Mayamaea pseudoterrestris]|nr:hypothetical protein MPSEU_000382800 [Mayamaea pseudoterrestris]